MVKQNLKSSEPLHPNPEAKSKLRFNIWVQNHKSCLYKNEDERPDGRNGLLCGAFRRRSAGYMTEQFSGFTRP